MERFVQLVVGGGVVLLAGLWIATLVRAESGPWYAGVALGLCGSGALTAGIWSEIDL